MPIRHDLSALSTGEQIDADPPRRPKIVHLLAERWVEQFGNKYAEASIPDAGPYRASMASSRCDRQLEYALRGTDKSNPPGLADIYRMNLGTTVHDLFETQMDEQFPDSWESEVTLDLRDIGIPGSQRIDGIKTLDNGDRIPFELKTQGGFGFKMCATNFKGPPEGPRSGHRLQLAYAVVHQDAPYGVLAYLSLECLSPDIFKSIGGQHDAEKFAAEWVLSREDADILVDYERARIERVLRRVTAGDDHLTRMLHGPDRGYPTGAIVKDPTRGTWVVMVNGQPTQTGRTWMCGYCDYRDQCIEDGEGYTQLELADEDVPF